MAADEYVVTRTADSWPDDRYKITGGPPLVRSGRFAFDPMPMPWVEWSWTIRAARWRIRRRKALLARVDKVVYRESA